MNGLENLISLFVSMQREDPAVTTASEDDLVDAIVDVAEVSADMATFLRGMLEQVNRDRRLMLISALTLSALNCPDQEKLAILAHYSASSDNQLCARSLAGYVLTVLMHADSLGESEQVCSEIASWAGDEHRVNVLMQLQANIFRATAKWRKPKSPARMIANIMEGRDMNLAMFAKLKGHPYFERLAHWLVPFDEKRLNLKNMNGNHNLQQMLKLSCGCDVDKYAIILMVDQMMSAGKMLEIKMPQVVGEAELENVNVKQIKSLSDSYASELYVQTLVRLMTFCPMVKNIKNPFAKPLYFADIKAIADILPIEFFHGFTKLMTHHNDYSRAERYLLHYIREKGPSVETLLLLGKTYAKSEHWQEALEVLTQAEGLDADNVDVLYEKADALMYSNRWEEALKLFFRFEFTDVRMHHTMRAIAWCSLRLGNVNRAMRYYGKLLNWEDPSKVSWRDCLNAGHATWAAGDEQSAEKLYAKFVEKFRDGNKRSTKEAMKVFTDDYDVLLQLGKTSEDVQKMMTAIMA